MRSQLVGFLYAPQNIELNERLIISGAPKYVTLVALIVIPPGLSDCYHGRRSGKSESQVIVLNLREKRR